MLCVLCSLALFALFSRCIALCMQSVRVRVCCLLCSLSDCTRSLLCCCCIRCFGNFRFRVLNFFLQIFKRFLHDCEKLLPSFVERSVIRSLSALNASSSQSALPFGNFLPKLVIHSLVIKFGNFFNSVGLWQSISKIYIEKIFHCCYAGSTICYHLIVLKNLLSRVLCHQLADALW